MTAEQVRKLIAEENENRLDATMATARKLINRITELQQAKVDCDKRIAEAREELRKLNATTVSETDIIGGF